MEGGKKHCYALGNFKRLFYKEFSSENDDCDILCHYLASRLVMERLLVHEQLLLKMYRLIRLSEVFLQNRYENASGTA